MSELIDREATVKQICKMGEMLGMCHDRDVIISVALFVQDDKSAFPTEERPHGEWIPYTTIDGYTKHATCTNCGYERKVGIGCSLDEENLPKFCENCGADMRREGEAE